jgi:hypothetical protein
MGVGAKVHLGGAVATAAVAAALDTSFTSNQFEIGFHALGAEGKS